MLDDLMNSMLSGGESESDEDKPDADELANLLGGLLGGSADQEGADAGDLLAGLLGGAGSQEAGDVGDLLGAVLGGGGSEGAGEMGALTILNAIMGGGGAETGVSSMLEPVTDHLAKKLGVPPETAQMIVMFVVGKLLSSRARGAGATRSRATMGRDEVDFDDVLAHMNEGGLDTDYLQSTGMVDELSQQTGLDSDTAARGLQEAFEMLGGQLGQGQ